MINSNGFPRLYEKIMSVFRLCVRNSALYEKFIRLPPSVREIHVGGQVCMINLALYEKFIWPPPSVREIHVGGQVCMRNLALYEKFI